MQKASSTGRSVGNFLALLWWAYLAVNLVRFVAAEVQTTEEAEAAGGKRVEFPMAERR